MSATPCTAERRPGFLLHEVSHLLRREFDRRVDEAGVGLTRAQWMILRQIGRQAGSSQCELARALRLEAATVGRHVDRLGAAGWLERRNDPRDGRAYRLHLRPRARQALSRLQRLGAQLREEYFAGIPARRREVLIDDLLVIRRNLLACRAHAGHRPPSHASAPALQAAR
jgi:MarR family transcriptional regulator, transcriptional regulator for hemolysin